MNEERKGIVNQIMADSAELIQAERRKGGYAFRTISP